MQTQSHNANTAGGRRGFTLIEMLVVIGVLAILSVMTLTLYNVSVDSDRIRSSARQIQSYLEGARDRAIFAGARQQPNPQRGVRFLLSNDGTVDANGRPLLVRSMVFIGESAPIQGELTVAGDQVTATLDTNSLSQNRWWSNLYARGLIDGSVRITVYDSNTVDGNGNPDGNPQTMFLDAWTFTDQDTSNSPPDEPILPDRNDPNSTADPIRLRFAEIMQAATAGSTSGPFIFQLELLPAVLPNQEPIELGRGIFIQLDVPRVFGKLPRSWYGYDDNGTPMNTSDDMFPYTDKMDILFSPRGVVVGSAASQGLIHLYLADIVDIEQNRGLGNPNREGDELLLTIFTRTGQISSHPLDPTDRFENADPTNMTPDGIPDDPFRYAETGEVAD